MKTCDLHTHSLYSDGSFSPAEIIAEAKRLGLTVALTDHNTVAGLPEFMAAAEQQGVTAVAGTELTTDHNGTELHLLGLFIRPEHYDDVEFFLKEKNILKEIRNMEMVERLNAAGYHIDYFSVKRRTQSETINRAHVAAELMEKGYVSSVSEAFNTILDEKQGFYVPASRTRLLDAIVFLRSIRALPVLAHPLQELGGQALRELLPDAIDAGLVGIEGFHSSYTDRHTDSAARIAADFGIAVSGGSDFHGSTKPNISLGVGKGDLAIPERVYLDLCTLRDRLYPETN